MQKIKITKSSPGIKPDKKESSEDSLANQLVIGAASGGHKKKKWKKSTELKF